MISVQNISKQFGDFTALNDVSLSIKRGEIFGLLGPNAAGKSTLLRTLCGLLKPTQGSVELAQQPIHLAKQHFGYVAQNFGQYEDLTVWENIVFYAKLYGIDDKQYLLSLIKHYGLSPYKKKFARELSGGFQRRLALCCALVHDPDILFLDEPTAGIDPVTRKQLWDDFYALAASGKTLFVTTHYMEEAQRCMQLAFIIQGKIIAQGSPESIKEVLGPVIVYTLKTPYTPNLHNALQQSNQVLQINQFGDELRIICPPKTDMQAIEAIMLHELPSASLTLSTLNLEDLFMMLSERHVDSSQ